MFYKDSRQVYRVRELEPYSWLDLGFGTRHSGLWMHSATLALHQVHSDRCVWVPPGPWPEPEARGSMLGEGDGLLSDLPGVHVSIRTADCIPVLLADLRRRAAAAVHAGWRGTVAQIAAKAVSELLRSGSRPEDLVAAVGPGICGSCYTVGPEVARQFHTLFPERSDLEGTTQVDLPEANRRQLVAAGLRPERVFSGAPCTFCTPVDFHSYRRGGKAAGRMFSGVGIVEL